MKLYRKTCKNPDCGKGFMGTRTQQYCGPDCRIRLRKVKQIKDSTINEVATEAKKHGISYGQYVAMQYQAERKKK